MFMAITEGKPNGAFLVRESGSSLGDYVLSVLSDDEVNHYQIRKHTEDFFSIGNSFLNNTPLP